MNKSNITTMGSFHFTIGLIATVYLFQFLLMAYIVDYSCGSGILLPVLLLLGCILVIYVLLFLLYIKKVKQQKIFSIYLGILFSCISFVSIVSYMAMSSGAELSLVLPLAVLILTVLGLLQVYYIKKNQWNKNRVFGCIIIMIYIIAILPLFYLLSYGPYPLTFLVTYFVTIIVLNWITTNT